MSFAGSNETNTYKFAGSVGTAKFSFAGSAGMKNTVLQVLPGPKNTVLQFYQGHVLKVLKGPIFINISYVKNLPVAKTKLKKKAATKTKQHF